MYLIHFTNRLYFNNTFIVCKNCKSLLILRIRDGKAPRFPKKPEIRQEGDRLVMECLLEANPEPEVTWFKDEKVILVIFYSLWETNKKKGFRN